MTDATAGVKSGRGRKKLWVELIVIAAILLWACYYLAEPGTVRFARGREALAEAQQREELILVHFADPQLPLCRRMLEETFGHRSVAEFAHRHFRCVFLDSRDAPDLFRQWTGEGGLQATCVVLGDAEVLGVLPGFAEVDSCLAFLRDVMRSIPQLRRLRSKSHSNPADGPTAVELARCEIPLGLWHLAEPRLRRFLDQTAETAEPALVMAHELLARGWAERGQSTRAREHLEAAERLDPGADQGSLEGRRLTEILVLLVERRPDEAAHRLQQLDLAVPDGLEMDRRRTVAETVLEECEALASQAEG